MSNGKARRARITEGLVTLTIVLATGALQAGDWPAYRHDSARTGWTADALRLPLSERWVSTAPDRPRMAWPGEEGNRREGLVMVQRVKFDDVFHVAVVKDRVYFGSSVDHRVNCLRVADGRTQWSFCTGGPVRLAPTVGEDRVWFGSDDGYAYCLEAGTGRLLWKLRAAPAEEWLLARGEMISRWPVRTGVLVDRGVAYFGAGIFPHENVYLCAVDSQTGKLLWKQDGISESNFERNDLSPQGHLLLQGDMLYVPSGRTLPALVDCRDGRVVQKPSHSWRFAKAGGGDIGGSEALLADGQIYSFGAREIFAMDGATAKIGFAWFTGEEMVVDRDTAYVATGSEIRRLDRRQHAEASRQRDAIDRRIYALNASKPSKPRNAKQKEEDQTQPTIDSLGKKSAELAEVGVIWKTPWPESVSLMGAGNVLFVGGRGSVAALDAASGKELWRHAVEGTARGLAAAADCLWVSTTAGKVYCLGAAGAKPASAAVVTQQSPCPADQDGPAYEAAAAEILRSTGVKRGYCLVLGGGRGRLAYELARKSQLKIYAVEPDASLAEKARQALSAAGLYGTRVVVHCFPLDAIPYSNYFANLIVSDGLSPEGRLPDAAKVVRHLKPCGGVICVGRPAGRDPGSASARSLTSWLKSAGLGEQGQIRTEGSWAILARGALPGAGSWTHQYGEPGNSACGDDQRVRGDLGVLWYGEPGPGEMVNRHNAAVAPLAMDGRFFIQGEHKILAYDAYNGLFLWEVDDPQANRQGTGLGNNPGNLAAGDGRIFVVAGNQCRELDAATGREVAVHRLPSAVDAKRFTWQYVAYLRGTLVGTAVQRREAVDKAQRRGRSLAGGDVLFAIDTRSARTLWTYTGHSITPSTVAVAPDRVFLIDNSLTDRERDAFLRQDKSRYQQLSGDALKQAEAELKKIDVRQAVALDLGTGAKRWSQAVDVTDCSEIGSAGGRLSLMHHEGVLVVCGANGNGHYWAQFLAGEFKRRRLVALNAEDGHRLWAKDANYRSRPIIVGQRVIAEPWAFDLRSGQQQTRPSVFTGAPVPWSMLRPGHHCGTLAASPHMLTFRSHSIGYYDLDGDVGTEHFSGQRPGCWINAIPANGLAIVPEASAGCVCLFSVQCTTVLEPRAPRRNWAVASCVGPQTPVRHLALNLGAPGDRRDPRGTLWLAYPRPTKKTITGLEIVMDLKPKFLQLGGYRGLDSEDHPVRGTDTPWLFTTWAQGLQSLSVPLVRPADGPARYDVKLYFAELGPTVPGNRVFDVKIQGKTMLSRLDVGAESGAATVREIRDVTVADSLLLELSPVSPDPSAAQMPILSALEISRRD